MGGQQRRGGRHGCALPGGTPKLPPTGQPQRHPGLGKLSADKMGEWGGLQQRMPSITGLWAGAESGSQLWRTSTRSQQMWEQTQGGSHPLLSPGDLAQPQGCCISPGCKPQPRPGVERRGEPRERHSEAGLTKRLEHLHAAKLPLEEDGVVQGVERTDHADQEHLEAT